ncbi:hypothetical protein BDV95DRAFT_599356 [Massariosphaeria phaeospora]|uniref:Phosphatidylglycerol/phosphatidylinositol transfer protein n=1 Tax=Massariosphaeria phaeospora TaxID=100035 RepID=A0A7C8MCJ2_9PLEO|nr:hypothetical protein BDV95DRAFT_599356 [Massariosphaeria phaeospora]
MFAPSALVLAFLSAISLSQATVLTVESTPGSVAKQCILVNDNIVCPETPTAGATGTLDFQATIMDDGIRNQSNARLIVDVPEQDTIQLNTELCLWGSSSGFIGCASKTKSDVVVDVPY